MGYRIDLPLVNSIKLFEQKDFMQKPANSQISGFNLNYNSTPFDQDWFINQIKEWETDKCYLQPYQKGDMINIAFNSDVVSDEHEYEVRIIDFNNNVIKTATPSKILLSGIYHYTVSLKLYDVPEGKYFVQITHDSQWYPNQKLWLISEPIHVKEVHENTVLSVYRNSYNAHGVMFEQTGVYFYLRYPGALIEVQPKSEIETYASQQLNQILLSGRPYRQKQLYVGIEENLVPEWVADKVERSLCCDDHKIDNEYITREADSELEPNRIAGYPLNSWKISVRQEINSSSLNINDIGIYNFGVLPKSRYFYVERIEQDTDPDVPIQKHFNGARNFIDYLNSTFSLKGIFTLNSNHELIYKFEATEFALRSTWLFNNTRLFGVLQYWSSVTLESTAITSNDLEVVFVGAGNRAAVYGDGNVESYGTGNLLHAYGAVGRVQAFIFYDTQTEISLKSAGDYAIESLSAEVAPTLQKLKSPSEIISKIEGDLFTFASGAFIELDLTDNRLPVAQIDNVIMMLQDANSNNKLGTGALKTSGQTPLAPPSGGSDFAHIIHDLRQTFTLTTD